ncbi:MAG: glycosyltransferase family 39 protein [Anaerolineales bacterium]|nr:glycosyltransferase family 39 protein [Anaerolineales bacterium]
MTQRLNPAMLFLFLAIVLGGFVRLLPALLATHPINDGGLFYTMTRDLAANGYRLPETTSYNQLDLPFAYPPLGFFFSGLLADLTGWELLDIFRILPAVFSLLAIPAFYLLGESLLDKNWAGIAALVFALLPPTFDWLIMGGGITRALAFLFYLLALHRIYHLYTRQVQRDILWTAAFSALTVLSHPEAGLHLAAGGVTFFLLLERNRSGVRKSLLVAALVLLLSAAWWLPVLARHGLAPFLAAGRTSGHQLDSFIQLLTFDFTNEEGPATIGTLALLGIFWCLAKKQYLLPIWVGITFLIEPRSAPLYLAPGITVLAVMALKELLTALDRREQQPAETAQTPFQGRAAQIGFAILMAQWLFSATTLALTVSQLTVRSVDLAAFDWVEANTPEGSRFLVLTGNEPMTDPVSEWFPALTGRTSLATLQGNEWNAAIDFSQVFEADRLLQACLFQSPDCLETWQTANAASPDYIYMHSLNQGQAPPLQDMLLACGRYEPVYATDGVIILLVK